MLSSKKRVLTTRRIPLVVLVFEYISFTRNRSIKVNEEITHCDTIYKLTAKTRGQEKKR